MFQKYETLTRKTTPREDKVIAIKSKTVPFRSSHIIMADANTELGFNMSSRLVRRN